MSLTMRPKKDSMPPEGCQPKRSRTKTGCIPCRIRRKKCDENLPSCQACIARNCSCFWLSTEEFAWRMRLGEDQSRALASTAAGYWILQKLPPGVTIARGLDPGRIPRLSHDARRMLEYFEERTTYGLSGFVLAHKSENPWYNELLPLAQGDDLVLNSLIAAGGSHMAHIEQDEAIGTLAYVHYGKAMRALQPAIAAWVKERRGDPSRLFYATAMLAVYECIDGGLTAMWNHIFAARQFAQSVGMYEIAEQPTSDMVGILLELDLLMELHRISRMKVNEEEIREAAQTLPKIIEKIRPWTTFGSKLGAADQMMMLIPCIAMLVIQRRIPKEGGEAIDCHTKYEIIKTKLTAWRFSPDAKDSIDEQLIKRAAAKLIQAFLHIFLETAYWHNHIPVQELGYMVEPYVRAGFLWLDDICDTPATKVTFWPVVVLGSYVRSDKQRATVTNYLRSLRMLGAAKHALWLLECVWNHPSQDVFGLPGLEAVAVENDTFFPVG